MLGTVPKKSVAYVRVDFADEVEMAKCFDGRTFFGHFEYNVDSAGKRCIDYRNDGYRPNETWHIRLYEGDLFVERGEEQAGLLAHFSAVPPADGTKATLWEWNNPQTDIGVPPAVTL